MLNAFARRFPSLLLLSLPLATAGAPPPTMTCLVVRVADGDTLTARCGAPGDYQQVKLRSAEIDAPEKVQTFGERDMWSSRSNDQFDAALNMPNGSV